MRSAYPVYTKKSFTRMSANGPVVVSRTHSAACATYGATLPHPVHRRRLAARGTAAR